MSKLFYDNHITLTELEEIINKTKLSKDEKLELWQLIDELTHQKIVNVLLSHLPKQHHEHLLLLIKDKPHDTTIIEFVEENSESNIAEELQKESEILLKELQILIDPSFSN